MVAGAAILAIDRLARPATPPAELSDASTAAPDPIHITDDVLADVRHRLTDGLGRAPTTAEFEAAVERWIDDELMLREARRLGLGDRDPVIRSRLAARMAELYRARAVPDRPDDAALRALYAAHRADYRLPDRLTLRQLFVAAAEPAAHARARQAADALRAHAEASGDMPASPAAPPGGPLLRGRRPARLAETYGPAFIDGLLDAPLGTWLIRPSPAGWHVLRIERRTIGRQLEFAAVRDRLSARWTREHAAAAAERAIADLRARAAIRGWPRGE